MLKAAMIFGCNMVLQRRKNIRIWGVGTVGGLVTGKLIGTETIVTDTQIDMDGKWMLIFPPQEAERDLVLTISDDQDTLNFYNISIGEVWLAGGQSNMEYPLHYDAEKESVLEEPYNLDIRFFDYPEVSYEGQLEDYDYSAVGKWRLCSREDLPYFSAVGYYFAENLHKTMDVPIGIVGCNWGGITACSLMDCDSLKDNEGKAWLEAYEEAVKDLDIEAYKSAFYGNPMNDRSNPLKAENGILGKIMYPGLTREEQMDLSRMFSADQGKNLQPQIGPYYERRPGGLYETMLKKVAPYTIRGVIWYQGESDSEKAELYGTVFGKMIESWRKLWEDPFPFLFVQLAPFEEWLACTGGSFPELRKQQEFVSKTVSDTWMISSCDAGMQWDIHPKHKKPIGVRLALQARGHIYGENLLCDPPELLSAKRVQEGIYISFRYADGLHLVGDQVNALMILDEEGKEIQPAEISVVEEGLLITGDFPKNTTISFAQTGYYNVNLYNKESNPVKPFKVTV